MRYTEYMLLNNTDFELLDEQLRAIPGAMETVSNRIDDLIVSGASKEVIADGQNQLEALAGIENFISELLWSLGQDGAPVPNEEITEDIEDIA